MKIYGIYALCFIGRNLTSQAFDAVICFAAGDTVLNSLMAFQRCG